jgi:hypothetical protein
VLDGEGLIMNKSRLTIKHVFGSMNHLNLTHNLITLAAKFFCSQYGCI